MTTHNCLIPERNKKAFPNRTTEMLRQQYNTNKLIAMLRWQNVFVSLTNFIKIRCKKTDFFYIYSINTDNEFIIFFNKTWLWFITMHVICWRKVLINSQYIVHVSNVSSFYFFLLNHSNKWNWQIFMFIRKSQFCCWEKCFQ